MKETVSNALHGLRSAAYPDAVIEFNDEEDSTQVCAISKPSQTQKIDGSEHWSFQPLISVGLVFEGNESQPDRMFSDPIRFWCQLYELDPFNTSGPCIECGLTRDQLGPDS